MWFHKIGKFEDFRGENYRKKVKKKKRSNICTFEKIWNKKVFFCVIRSSNHTIKLYSINLLILIMLISLARASWLQLGSLFEIIHHCAIHCTNTVFFSLHDSLEERKETNLIGCKYVFQNIEEKFLCIWVWLPPVGFYKDLQLGTQECS